MYYVYTVYIRLISLRVYTDEYRNCRTNIALAPKQRNK